MFYDMRFLKKATVLVLLGALSMTSVLASTGNPVRQQADDLEIGYPGRPHFFMSRAALAQAGPVQKIRTEKDPELGKPAVYEGLALRQLAQILQVPAEFDVLAAWCVDGYVSYYPPSYLKDHDPLLILFLNGQKDWPKTHSGISMGPYYIAEAAFVPVVRVLAYTEEQRYPYGVVRLQFLKSADYAKALSPKKQKEDPLVLAGQTIASASCLSCHNNGQVGGLLGQRPWQVLGAHASGNGDYFLKFIQNPGAYYPDNKMPAYNRWDQKTLEALKRYFIATQP